MNKLLLSVTFFLFSAASWAAQDTNIRVTLEEPSSFAVASGISNLRGWAVAPNGIERVELYINGFYVDDIPYGGQRIDVGNAFPSYPNSDNSGYSMAWAYSLHQSGSNQMTIVAYDNLGNFNIAETVFQVEKFASSFIADPNQIDLTAVDDIRVLDKNTFVIEGVSVEGQDWDVQLKWQTATQGFDIALIEPVNSSGNPLEGIWRGQKTVSGNGESCTFGGTRVVTATSSTTGTFKQWQSVIADNAPNADCFDIQDTYSEASFSINGNVVTLTRTYSSTGDGVGGVFTNIIDSQGRWGRSGEFYYGGILFTVIEIYTKD